jgi:hypothetical protein
MYMYVLYRKTLAVFSQGPLRDHKEGGEMVGSLLLHRSGKTIYDSIKLLLMNRCRQRALLSEHFSYYVLLPTLFLMEHYIGKGLRILGTEEDAATTMNGFYRSIGESKKRTVFISLNTRFYEKGREFTNILNNGLLSI